LDIQKAWEKSVHIAVNAVETAVRCAPVVAIAGGDPQIGVGHGQIAHGLPPSVQTAAAMPSKSSESLEAWKLLRCCLASQALTRTTRNFSVAGAAQSSGHRTGNPLRQRTHAPGGSFFVWPGGEPAGANAGSGRGVVHREGALEQVAQAVTNQGRVLSLGVIQSDAGHLAGWPAASKSLINWDCPGIDTGFSWHNWTDSQWRCC